MRQRHPGCLYIAAMPNCHEAEACVHPAEEAEGRQGGFKKKAAEWGCSGFTWEFHSNS